MINGGGRRTVVIDPLVRVEGRTGVGSGNSVLAIVNEEGVNRDASV